MRNRPVPPSKNTRVNPTARMRQRGLALDGGAALGVRKLMVSLIVILQGVGFTLLGGEGARTTQAYSPATVRPSMRMVGAATDPRNSRSLPISLMWKNMSLRLPPTVISSTG